MENKVRTPVNQPPYSKVTRDMIELMMQESGLNSCQRRQISKCLKNGEPLPRDSNPPPSAPKQPKPAKGVQNRLPTKPLRRSAESCRSGDNYRREKFQPGPTRDLEKEKSRLQNLLATGNEAVSIVDVSACAKREVMEVTDPIQELLDQIEERRQFLADMAALGQEKQYSHIINTEISQKISELDILEKKKVQEKSQGNDGPAVK